MAAGNSFGSETSAEHCAAVRDQAGATFTVVWDNDGQFLQYADDRDSSLLYAEDGTIVFQSEYGDPHGAIWDAVAAELASTP